ncbi:MAG: hypothetical protein GEV11_05130 [Streptosporangiales bacterium]|nr:hypothetical protein [Streptosporangiales bacterium]
MRAKPEHVAATVFDLAERGMLRLEWVPAEATWRLIRTGGPAAGLRAYEFRLLSVLFGGA